MGSEEETGYYIYYRNQGHWGSLSPRDHLIKDGESVCYHDVKVPDKDSLKPLDSVSRQEWALLLAIHSNLCRECESSIWHLDLPPNNLPNEPPEYVCPICDEPTDYVDFMSHLAHVNHIKERDPFGLHPGYETHKIPREFYDAWRRNPEEPFSFAQLKSYIDENRDLFDDTIEI